MKCWHFCLFTALASFGLGWWIAGTLWMVAAVVAAWADARNPEEEDEPCTKLPCTARAA